MNRLLSIVFLFTILSAPTLFADESATHDDAESTSDNYTARGVINPTKEIPEIFIDLPNDILELIPQRTRRDMVDYMIYADSIWDAPNNLNGISRLIELSSHYAKVEVTDVSTMEMKLLNTKKAPIVALAYTIRGEAADSKLLFLDTIPNQISNKKLFKEPKLKDFFNLPKGSLTTIKEIEQMIGFSTVEYSLNPKDCTLTARLTIDKHINQDDYNIIRLFLIDKLVYEWNGKKFVKRKQ